MSDLNIIVTMQFGSQLYGTATPESDTDYKGVFMPDRREVFLGRIPKSLHIGTPKDDTKKNAPTDVDHEVYSLHYFVHLACEGETVALDMLHAPERSILAGSSLWSELVANRQRFYTKNLRALVGYARRQAAKYGVKGSRLADARTVLAVLEASDPMERVGNLALPELEHARWTDGPNDRHYDMCGRQLQEGARVEHYLPMVRGFVAAYGDRARQAERNEGIDWKAISHAFRAAYQVRGILVDGGFTYPLPQTEYLRRVKAGAVPFVEASAALEAEIDELERFSASSSLPAKVDRGWWDAWLCNHVAKATA